MSLIEVNVPPILDTSSHDLFDQFFVPVLNVSIRYDRGVGYFSSGWLRMASFGLAKFAENGGHARWITSPILDSDDWDAMIVGDEARSDAILHEALRKSISDLTTSLEEDTRSALAWMVADGVIEFRIAVPRNKLEMGEFHDKFGVFQDLYGNRISFSGSYNDSIQGTLNYESLKVFREWDNEMAAEMVAHDANRFQKLWGNLDPNVRVFTLPEAIKARLLKLRTSKRPYKLADQRPTQAHNLMWPLSPTIPAWLQLRDYQREAIDAWFAAGCRGLLEMATGTGKTLTALTAATELFHREESLAVVILVPFQHLVDQWNVQAEQFGLAPILAYESKARWLDTLNHEIVEFNRGYRKSICVISTYSSFSDSDFQSSVNRLSGRSLIIADEAHYLGAENTRRFYPEHIDFRLGLSATPDRWFDDIGTAALRNYLGATIYSFPLAKAIGVSLTPYYYYPHLVTLTDIEMEQYEALSKRIAVLVNQTNAESEERLKLLLIQRAQLLNNAENKIPILAALVDQQENLRHTLFYCAPGQFDQVLHLLGWEKSLQVHGFTAKETAPQRQELLRDFAAGELQGLVAMKCLDEGVDVPNTRTAFLLASSSNPREFIQRRGRILRKAPGKTFSYVHDLIALPPDTWNSTSRDSPTFGVERSIVRRELQRFKEFADPAQNTHQALDVVWAIAKRYGLMDF